MTVNESTVINASPPGEPWYSSRAWYAVALGAVAMVATLIFGVQHVAITVSAGNVIYLAGAVTLFGCGSLALGYLRSRGGLRSRRELS